MRVHGPSKGVSVSDHASTCTSTPYLIPLLNPHSVLSNPAQQKNANSLQWVCTKARRCGSNPRPWNSPSRSLPGCVCACSCVCLCVCVCVQGLSLHAVLDRTLAQLRHNGVGRELSLPLSLSLSLTHTHTLTLSLSLSLFLSLSLSLSLSLCSLPTDVPLPLSHHPTPQCTTFRWRTS